MFALISGFLVSGKALAAGVFSRPAASALPLTKPFAQTSLVVRGSPDPALTVQIALAVIAGPQETACGLIRVWSCSFEVDQDDKI